MSGPDRSVADDIGDKVAELVQTLERTWDEFCGWLNNFGVQQPTPPTAPPQQTGANGPQMGLNGPPVGMPLQAGLNGPAVGLPQQVGLNGPPVGVPPQVGLNGPVGGPPPPPPPNVAPPKPAATGGASALRMKTTNMARLGDGNVGDKAVTKEQVDKLVADGNLGELAKLYAGGVGFMTPELKKQVRDLALGDPKTYQTLLADKNIAADIITLAEPPPLDEKTVTEKFGDGATNAHGAALMKLAKSTPASDSFDQLYKRLPPDVWNDSKSGLGAKKGFGPQVCVSLWNSGGFDQICKLIDHGVDTSLAFNTGTDWSGQEGVYSGFVQPIDHMIGNYIRALEEPDAGIMLPEKKNHLEGVRKVVDALEKKHGDDVPVVTKWKDVKESDFVKAFKQQPGTIWGFEDVRRPFVQAAHEEDEGKRPLRMMEIWDAFCPLYNPQDYAKVLEDPKSEIPKIIDMTSKALEAKLAQMRTDQKTPKGIGREDEKYLYILDMGDNDARFVAGFRKQATAFLEEFAAQVPKGSKPAIDDKGDAKKIVKDGKIETETTLDIAGIAPDKYMGGLACKVGLWWAKSEKEPVYYCLDGIKMEDATNYKKVKNATIDAHVSGGDNKKHQEVITLVEIREILKNWDDLSETVKFVQKGKILSGPELEGKVAGWIADMKQANEAAKRAPAPDASKFANEINALSPKLMGMINATKQTDPKEGDMDARDVVRKSGYLERIANTRPTLALKYLMGRCKKLIQYDLVDGGVPDAAGRVLQLLTAGRALVAKPSADPGYAEQVKKALEDLEGAAGELGKLVGECCAKFRDPLRRALVDGPLSEARAWV